jgi:hypothetical protein
VNFIAIARALAAAALALTVSATAVPSSADAPLPTANTAPAVCAYLGVINGTRTIDPGFVSGAKATPPSAATPSPSLNAGATLLGLDTTAASTSNVATAATSTSNYCHVVPPLVPVSGGGG